MLSHLFFFATFSTSAISCPDYSERQAVHLVKRADNTADWTYEAEYDWGAIRPEYALCQTGTQQSPIALSLATGSSLYHRPTFENYDRNVSGNWTNWGYGPEFNLAHPPNDYSRLPSVRWDNEAAYLLTWHIHAPADHPVNGDRSRAELHLVHVNANGEYVAVFGIRIDPGTTADNPFFAQLPKPIPFVTTPGISPEEDPEGIEIVQDVQMDIGLLLNSVDRFNDFWTYRGGLTSPPCAEGLRWFVAQKVAVTSTDQMRQILGACTFSARAAQPLWLHDVNGQ
ncbi:MAG: hypothetical protein LQ352_007805 [Teloschistes flavicans]|nr:MAG: hypothetical protein LQ352_007805 [Teloschistes flavicans]